MTTTPDFRALLVELTELQGHVLVECTEEWADVMDRARAALATTAPNFCALCAALDLEAMKLYDKGYSPKLLPVEPTTSQITFNDSPTEEVIRLDKEGFHYKGQFIADAGEAHRLMLAFLKQHAKVEPEPPHL